MNAGRWGLRSRLLVSMVAVAVVSFLAVALLTAPFVRASAERSARGTLARQADLMSQIPRASMLSRRLDAQAELRADVRGLSFGVVTTDGTATGAATALTDRQVDRLLAGREVSTRSVLDGRRVLIEARPVARGGAIALATPAVEVDRSVMEQRRRLWLALALGLLVALAVGAVTSRWLTRPLARVADSARRMGAGERGAVLPETGVREVAEVADALHHLDVALAGSEERQRRFLLSVSHELRTPLTAILGYAESLRDGVIPDAEVPEVAATVLAESQRLERYVADLLALARLEADDFDLRPEPVDAAEVVRGTVAAWQERAGRAGLTVTAEVSGGAVRLTTDPVRLRQVLDALVDNAVRVCPAGSTVVVAVAAHGSLVRLEVRDSGPGLSDDDAAVAFEPGALRDRYADERPVGSGLGLAVVDRLVARLGGSVRAGASAEGGAAFTIDLPGSPDTTRGADSPDVR